MIYLLCSILGSAMISIVMRLSQGRVRAGMGMLAANYLTCMACAWCFIGSVNPVPMVSGIGLTLTLGIFNGGIYLVSLMLTQYNVRRNGVVLQSVFSKIGDLLVPLVVSIAVFGERPGVLQILGAALAVAAIIAMNYDRQGSGSAAMMPLLALFLADGIVGAMSKIYGEVGAQNLASHFLLYTFGAAFVLSVVLMLRRGERPGLTELLFGMAVGIPNYFSSRFLLWALNTIDAVIAYPLRSVGSIVVVTAAGLLLFRERLRRSQWIAIAVIVVCVALLSV